MKKIVAVMLMLCMVVSSVGMTFADTSKDDIYYCQDISEKEYVKHLAEQNGISYEEAYKINTLENVKIVSMQNNNSVSSGEIGTNSLDEQIRYKQITKGRRIQNSNNYIMVSTEVKYLYSIPNDEAVEIINPGNPLMYIPGVSTYSVNGGAYNFNNSPSHSRISRTCTFSYELGSSDGISIGGDILGYTHTESGTVLVTTNAITVVMDIYLYDL